MRRVLAATAITGAITLVAPWTVSAATTQAGQSNLSLTAGSLAISVPFTTNLPSAALTAGSQSGGINTAQWSDLTGSGAGWHGTIAVQRLHISPTGAWSPTGHALATNDTATYTGGAGNAFYKVAVTADGGATISFTFSGSEAGTVTNASKAAAVGFGANGMSITFVPATTYTVADSYTAKVGNLPTTAVSLLTATGGDTANGTTAGGTNLPSLVNNTATVTSGTPTTYSAAPVSFVSAAVGAGVGTFNITAGVSIAWDPNTTWAATYTASAQYTLVSGP